MSLRSNLCPNFWIQWLEQTVSHRFDIINQKHLNWFTIQMNLLNEPNWECLFAWLQILMKKWCLIDWSTFACIIRMLPDMQYLPHFVSTKDQNCKHIYQSWCQDVITSNYGYVLKRYRLWFSKDMITKIMNYMIPYISIFAQNRFLWYMESCNSWFCWSYLY